METKRQTFPGAERKSREDLGSRDGFPLGYKQQGLHIKEVDQSCDSGIAELTPRSTSFSASRRLPAKRSRTFHSVDDFFEELQSPVIQTEIFNDSRVSIDKTLGFPFDSYWLVFPDSTVDISQLKEQNMELPQNSNTSHICENVSLEETEDLWSLFDMRLSGLCAGLLKVATIEKENDMKVLSNGSRHGKEERQGRKSREAKPSSESDHTSKLDGAGRHCTEEERLDISKDSSKFRSDMNAQNSVAEHTAGKATVTSNEFHRNGQVSEDGMDKKIVEPTLKKESPEMWDHLGDEVSPEENTDHDRSTRNAKTAEKDGSYDADNSSTDVLIFYMKYSRVGSTPRYGNGSKSSPNCENICHSNHQNWQEHAGPNERVNELTNQVISPQVTTPRRRVALKGPHGTGSEGDIRSWTKNRRTKSYDERTRSQGSRPMNGSKSFEILTPKRRSLSSCRIGRRTLRKEWDFSTETEMKETDTIKRQRSMTMLEYRQDFDTQPVQRNPDKETKFHTNPDVQNSDTGNQDKEGPFDINENWMKFVNDRESNDLSFPNREELVPDYGGQNEAGTHGDGSSKSISRNTNAKESGSEKHDIHHKESSLRGKNSVEPSSQHSKPGISLPEDTTYDETVLNDKQSDDHSFQAGNTSEFLPKVEKSEELTRKKEDDRPDNEQVRPFQKFKNSEGLVPRSENFTDFGHAIASTEGTQSVVDDFTSNIAIARHTLVDFDNSTSNFTNEGDAHLDIDDSIQNIKHSGDAHANIDDSKSALASTGDMQAGIDDLTPNITSTGDAHVSIVDSLLDTTNTDNAIADINESNPVLASTDDAHADIVNSNSVLASTHAAYAGIDNSKAFLASTDDKHVSISNSKPVLASTDDANAGMDNSKPDFASTAEAHAGIDNSKPVLASTDDAHVSIGNSEPVLASTDDAHASIDNSKPVLASTDYVHTDIDNSKPVFASTAEAHAGIDNSKPGFASTDDAHAGIDNSEPFLADTNDAHASIDNSKPVLVNTDDAHAGIDITKPFLASTDDVHAGIDNSKPFLASTDDAHAGIDITKPFLAITDDTHARIDESTSEIDSTGDAHAGIYDAITDTDSTTESAYQYATVSDFCELLNLQISMKPSWKKRANSASSATTNEERQMFVYPAEIVSEEWRSNNEETYPCRETCSLKESREAAQNLRISEELETLKNSGIFSKTEGITRT